MSGGLPLGPLTTAPMRMAALKLEALTDPSLPHNGPGRHETGNFQLGEVVLEVSQENLDAPCRLPIASTWASYSWEDRTVLNAIDGDRSTAWQVWDKVGQPHVAVFSLEEPFVTDKPTRLTEKLLHGGDLGPGIGRFRLSATSDNWLMQVAE